MLQEAWWKKSGGNLEKLRVLWMEQENPIMQHVWQLAPRGKREMFVPALLALLVPILTGLVLGVPGVVGLFSGKFNRGFPVGSFMANAGGAWDNAKKYIEGGALGGKGSPAHKAAVVGDTVGDPFKDTSGPSLNILIKLMSIVSVVFAGIIIKFSPKIGALLHLH